MEKRICAALTALVLALCAGCSGNAVPGASPDPAGSAVLTESPGPGGDPAPETAPVLDAAPVPGTALLPDTAPVPEAVPVPGRGADGIDVDLTAMSATMVYAEVFDMLDRPERYVGRTVRMQGECSSAYYEETDATYYTVIISDATACCAQGMEYLLREGSYPEDGVEATVTGEFETYEEDGLLYCRLRDAAVEI